MINPSVETITITHGTKTGPTAEIDLPQLGLGVYESAVGTETEQAVLWALETGYRHFDTAALYRNEADVGRAISRSGIGRNEIHVTTKLWRDGHGYEGTQKACLDSLKRLDLDYVDLYLVHQPPTPELRADTWRSMEALLKQGKTRAIGVSNHGAHHLDDMQNYATVMPSVNQIEMSPYLQRPALAKRCAELDIAITAYSPLTQGRKLDDPRLRAIATQHDKSPAQILIRWCLQMGYIVIPKSVHQDRIIENMNVLDFALTEEEMQHLAEFDEKFITEWDPTTHP